MNNQKFNNKTYSDCLKKYSDCQNEMVESAGNNPNKFWKTIGRIGVRDKRRKEMPMEILNDNGEVIMVLDK